MSNKQESVLTYLDRMFSGSTTSMEVRTREWREIREALRIAVDAVKDAYVHTPSHTEANRILAEALNKLHSMQIN